MFWTLLIAGLCYLIGSIPFPVIVSRIVKGIDLREYGSGNMGARNAARVLGKRWFPVVFGLDFLKGAAATYLGREVIAMTAGVDPVLGAAIGGLFAVAGHCFPVFVGFRGGVGLAASAGALAVVSPSLLVTGCAGIILLWRATRDMYVGVAATALVYPLMGWYWLRASWVVAVMALWGVLVFAVHWSEVSRWLSARRAG